MICCRLAGFIWMLHWCIASFCPITQCTQQDVTSVSSAMFFLFLFVQEWHGAVKTWHRHSSWRQLSVIRTKVCVIFCLLLLIRISVATFSFWYRFYYFVNRKLEIIKEHLVQCCEIILTGVSSNRQFYKYLNEMCCWTQNQFPHWIQNSDQFNTAFVCW